ncbi:vWA domain-containing protein [Myxococcota bacterium]
MRRTMLRALASAFVLCWVGPADAAPTGLDMVFLLDTTCSMSGEIREAKERVKQLADALATARSGQRIRIGVVAYRDREDAYLTKKSHLSSNVEDSFTFLASLEANGGGDSPEDVLTGLSVALKEMKWDSSAAVERQVFLIGDAPPHLDYSDGPRPEDLIDEAQKNAIVINAIGCRSLSKSGIDFFRRVAYSTEGSYQHVGRVRAEEPGLAEAMLRALTPTSEVEEVALEPVDATLAKRGELAGGEERPFGGIRHGVLVRHGRANRSEPGCAITVFLGNGLGLAKAPTFGLSDAVLQVELTVTQGAGGYETWELERCVDPFTPIRVSFGG